MSLDQTVVLIPTYNEALNAGVMLEKLFSLYPGISVLIIDDNSPDNTAALVESMKSAHPNLHLLKRSGKLGLGTAYIAGFKWALAQKKYQYILQMDCDFSHDPHDVIRLIEGLKTSNASLSIGSRYSENDIRTKDWPLHRLLLSLTASVVLRLFTGMKIRDMSGGFKCFHIEALKKINLEKFISKGYVFQFEMNYKIHANADKIIEVPITFHQRLHGESKMSGALIYEAVIVLMKLRWKKLLNQLN